jgi:opacity protein-like surface antigen
MEHDSDFLIRDSGINVQCTNGNQGAFSFMRQILRRRMSVLLGSVVFLVALAATAQENRSEISLQGAGFFTQGSSGNGTAYSTTQTGGFLSTYRYHFNHWMAAEAGYGFAVDSQKYLLSSSPFRVKSGIHQVTGSLVFNLPSRASSRLSPYFLAGAGALLFDPTGSQFTTVSGAESQAKAVFVYGVGLNYALRKRISLRAEYRGLVYGAPDFGFSSLTSNSITHTAEPSLGLTFRF